MKVIGSSTDWPPISFTSLTSRRQQTVLDVYSCACMCLQFIPPLLSFSLSRSLSLIDQHVGDSVSLTRQLIIDLDTARHAEANHSNRSHIRREFRLKITEWLTYRVTLWGRGKEERETWAIVTAIPYRLYMANQFYVFSLSLALRQLEFELFNIICYFSVLFWCSEYSPLLPPGHVIESHQLKGLCCQSRDRDDTIYHVITKYE